MADVTAERLRLDLVDVQDRIDAGLNLPSHCYTDQQIFDFELATIFDNSWMYFAPLERVAEPGSVITGQVGRVPVVVTRAEDGELRGFVNACRHRGYTVVDEDKQCSRMQCPYHAWIYGLDGTLLRTPRAEDANADLAELSLHPVAVTEWAHAIYVNPNPNAEPLRTAHPRIDEMADGIGINREPGAYTWVGRYVHDQAANWKLWYDNGTECYHCPTVHKDSFGAAYDVSDGAYTAGFWDTMYSGYFDPAPSKGSQMVGGSYRSVQLFPINQFIQQDDLMVVGRAIPNGPASTTFVVDYLAETGAPMERVEEWIKLWNRTYEEDARIVEQVQRNLASGKVTEMRYTPGLEDASKFMHALIWDEYRAALSS